MIGQGQHCNVGEMEANRMGRAPAQPIAMANPKMIGFACDYANPAAPSCSKI